MSRFSRFLRPQSVVVIGGGVWCRNVVQQLQLFGFKGEIWHVHPKAKSLGGVLAYPSLADLPGIPDAAFIGVNRHDTIKLVRTLSERGAGGAVCFASGFSEADAEDEGSSSLQDCLVEAAGDMPILGPNCYGFINALDSFLLWPDQHGCSPVDRGVAILTQSSNIAINLTMQRRGLPVGFVAACGNMAQVSQAALADALLDDPRVSAIGLHVEGFGDTAEWHALACRAFDKGVPLVVLKVGLSDQAKGAALSHTASLTGTRAGSDAFLDYLGVPQVTDLPTFLETLKVFHLQGRLDRGAIAAISCSGGEASLIADLATSAGLTFPPLSEDQKTVLSTALGPMVALSNPLDYHTYVWGDALKMAQAWEPMTASDAAMTLIILDYPHTDARAWEPATQAAIAVRRDSNRPVAVVASLPELMPAAVARELAAQGVVPFNGMREALGAVSAASFLRAPRRLPPAAPVLAQSGRVLEEAEAKEILRAAGLSVPRGHIAAPGGLVEAAARLTPPFVLKAVGLAHKSELGGLRLNLSADALEEAALSMPGDRFLIEEMQMGAAVELLVGITADPAHGYLLTVGAGGVLTELWQDTASLLLPADAEATKAALRSLRIAPLLDEYRGAPPVRIDLAVAAVLALQRCVLEAKGTIVEAEINPLLCTSENAVAVDALICVTQDWKGDAYASGQD
ncbi:MAG: acetate--CoA ligase family protein [Roseobacter sp.]